MKPALGYISLLIIGIIIMPFLVEPTPLTLWLDLEQKAPHRIENLRVDK